MIAKAASGTLVARMGTGSRKRTLKLKKSQIVAWVKNERVAGRKLNWEKCCAFVGVPSLWSESVQALYEKVSAGGRVSAARG